jgi:hypothetical protein
MTTSGLTLRGGSLSVTSACSALSVVTSTVAGEDPGTLRRHQVPAPPWAPECPG